MITIITHIIVVIIVLLGSVIRAKRRFLRCASSPNWGEGGGEVIWAMPERKHFFSGWLPLFDIAHL